MDYHIQALIYNPSKVIYIEPIKPENIDSFMPHRPLTVVELRDLIKKGEAKDPLIFLEAVMNGQDPRKLSSIYELIMEIDEFSGGEVCKEDWNEIVDHIMTRFKYSTVSMGDSMNASKTLAEYLHPKRKQVEITGSASGVGSVPDNPLSEEEIYLFREKFNDEY